MSGEKSCQGMLPTNFHKNCIDRLFSKTHLVLYVSYFMLFMLMLLIDVFVSNIFIYFVSRSTQPGHPFVGRCSEY